MRNDINHAVGFDHWDDDEAGCSWDLDTRRESASCLNVIIDAVGIFQNVS